MMLRVVHCIITFPGHDCQEQTRATEVCALYDSAFKVWEREGKKEKLAEGCEHMGTLKAHQV